MVSISGLYAITPDWTDPARIDAAVAAAIRGGARIVQVRSKQPAPLRRAITERVLATCRRHDVRCLVNDDLELAVALRADGVHLGRDDGAIEPARERLGDNAIIGVSCYGDFANALANPSATYVAFGSVFVSGTKPGAPRASLALFGQARAAGINAVAIGGITRENAASVIEAGADAICVIGELFGSGQPDQIEANARALSRLFDRDAA
ncbi:MAG: thiamine phosphate synthase [Burkholderiaceae bacterium]